jgi:hypothetical protein
VNLVFDDIGGAQRAERSIHIRVVSSHMLSHW